MRTPTPLAPLYDWHRQALAGQNPQITMDPQVGWFTRRLVKGGPTVPARIWLSQDIDPTTGELVGDEFLCCEVAGKARDVDDEWTYLAASPITEAEFNFRSADAAWCRTNALGSPEANPMLPVSTRAIPPLF